MPWGQPVQVALQHLGFPGPIQDGQALFRLIGGHLGHRLHAGLEQAGHFPIDPVDGLPGFFQRVFFHGERSPFP